MKLYEMSFAPLELIRPVPVSLHSLARSELINIEVLLSGVEWQVAPASCMRRPGSILQRRAVIVSFGEELRGSIFSLQGCSTVQMQGLLIG